jgi:hypothetical protein
MSDDHTPSPAITRLRQQRELQRKGLQEPESSGLTGVAAIKYAAIVRAIPISSPWWRPPGHVLGVEGRRGSSGARSSLTQRRGSTWPQERGGLRRCCGAS